MSHNIVLRAYERSLRAYEHSLQYNLPLRVDPEESDQMIKIQEKLQKLEKSCAEVTTRFKKKYAEIHNKEENEEVVDYDEADIDQDEDSDEDNLEEEKHEDEQYHNNEEDFEVEMEIDEEEVHLVEESLKTSTGDENVAKAQAPPPPIEETEAPLRTVKNWKRPEERLPFENDPAKFVVPSITGELIPINEMAEHMPISLIDPKYKEQEKIMMAKLPETTLDPNDESSRNIVGIARTRHDIFGTTIQTHSVGVPIDLLCAMTDLNLTVTPNVINYPLPSHECHLLDVTNPKSVSSLNGFRNIEQIKAFVNEDNEIYHATMLCLKLWAKRRGIYSNIVGYLGGITLTLLLCLVHQGCACSTRHTPLHPCTIGRFWLSPSIRRNNLTTDASTLCSPIACSLPCLVVTISSSMLHFSRQHQSDAITASRNHCRHSLLSAIVVSLTVES